MAKNDRIQHDRSESPREADGRTGKLVRLAGPRPSVSPERAARVKAAVRSSWEREVARGRRGRVWIAAALATATMVVLAVGVAMWRRANPLPMPPATARVETVAGSVWVRPISAHSTEPPVLVRPGDVLTVGSELATEGNDRVAIRIASGHSIRLDADSRLRILSERTLALDRGAVYVDSGSRDGRSAGSVRVHTSRGVVRDIGTQFEVRLGDTSLLVRVREGLVSIDGDRRGHEVSAGFEVEVDDEGRIRRRALRSFDAEWAWIGEITPMMEVEGRSLREFLDWVVRERGLRLRFARPGLSDSASRITLNGSIEGMSLDQALEAVLPTCRMVHRLERDVLLVEPMPEDVES